MNPGKTREALLSIGAALLLTLLKLGAGVTSGSIGLLAEAANSALDVFASGVTFLAVRYAEQPPDDEHPYGHGKAENLAAFAQSGLLLLTCALLVREALQRLFFFSPLVNPSAAAFGVMLFSLVVSGWRVRALRRAAALHQSQALEADALHFYTDLFTGAAVLAGLGAIWLGERLGLPWLLRADPVAALVVCGVLVHLTLQMGRRATEVLLDRSHERTEAIKSTARAVRGVRRVHGVRSRQVGAESFVEMNIDVARATAFEESHAIATQVEQAIHRLVPRAHVLVHVDPVRPPDESTVQALHTIARREGLAVHHIALHRIASRIVAHLHIELPARWSLIQAHDVADRFEAAALREVPELDEVVSHIEPTAEMVAEGPDVTGEAPSLVTLVERLQREIPTIRGSHDLTFQRSGEEIHLSIHCTFDPHEPLGEVHEAMARLERRLREAAPLLGRVVIHPEPDGMME